jgi:hypothetical protein
VRAMHVWSEINSNKNLTVSMQATPLSLLTLIARSDFGECGREARGPSKVLSEQIDNKSLQSLSDHIIVRVRWVIDLAIASLGGREGEIENITRV